MVGRTKIFVRSAIHMVMHRVRCLNIWFCPQTVYILADKKQQNIFDAYFAEKTILRTTFLMYHFVNMNNQADENFHTKMNERKIL